ncbi:MAG: hypothetical protein LH629_07490 [Ignavibacteria bacterium]|nr:hypothetical protein [Ignavibacteria bacterium]
MSEICFEKSKQYGYLKDGEVQECIKCKGITRACIKHMMNFQEMKRNLNPFAEDTDVYKTMKTFINKNLGMYVNEINKKALSPFDDKRWIADDGLTTKTLGF